MFYIPKFSDLKKKERKNYGKYSPVLPLVIKLDDYDLITTATHFLFPLCSTCTSADKISLPSG